nr:DUF5050 domain-containing protein [Paenibacillus sediminis]
MLVQLFPGSRYAEIVDAKSVQAERGNTNGNYRSGMMVQKGDWIYFSGYHNNSPIGLYKMKSDGTSVKKLTDRTPYSINVVGNWVYYMEGGGEIFRIRTDGTEKTDLKVRGDNLLVVGDWVYFHNLADNWRLYKVSVDGKTKKRLTSESVNDINIFGDWIYYINQTDYSIYKIKTDGSMRKKITGTKAGELLVTQDGWMYFSASETIYRMKTDGTSKSQVKQGFPVNESGEYLYYVAYDLSSGAETIFRTKKDGSMKQLLGNGRYASLDIVGEWIYYSTEVDNEWYRYKMKLDGSQNQVVSIKGLNSKTPPKQPVKSETNSDKAENPVTAPSTLLLYVNSNAVDAKQGEPITRGGVLYVPVEPIVTGMGDTFKYISKPTAVLITKKDGTVIQVDATKSTAVVNGELVPISSMTLKDTKVPVQAKPVIVINNVYVPFDFIKNVLGYESGTFKQDSKDVVYVGKKPSNVPTTTPTPTPTPDQSSGGGKLDLPQYKTPAGWTPPQIKSEATEDWWKNKDILEKELGFINGTHFNPYGGNRKDGASLIVSDGYGGYYTNIVFYYWCGSLKNVDVGNKTPYIARELFHFYFGNESGDKLFKIMEDAYSGKDTSYVNTPFTIGGRQVKIVDNKDSVYLLIGNKK